MQRLVSCAMIVDGYGILAKLLGSDLANARRKLRAFRIVDALPCRLLRIADYTLHSR